MRKRRVYPILAALALVAMFIWLSVRNREPEYGGKRLRQWVLENGAIGHVEQAELDKAADAISHIGMDAIPHLLVWGRYHTPRWRAKLMKVADKLPDSFQFDWMAVDERHTLGVCVPAAFAVLGDRARGAIPPLVARISDPAADSENKTWAIYSLGCLGPEAVPPLLHALTNADSAIRRDVVGGLFELGTNALPALPMIIDCLHDGDEAVAIRAVWTLRELKLQPARAVPALRVCLSDPRPRVNQAAARALKEFLADARPAVPDLLRMLEATNSASRQIATNALRAIDPDVLARLRK